MKDTLIILLACDTYFSVKILYKILPQFPEIKPFQSNLSTLSFFVNINC